MQQDAGIGAIIHRVTAQGDVFEFVIIGSTRPGGQIDTVRHARMDQVALNQHDGDGIVVSGITGGAAELDAAGGDHVARDGDVVHLVAKGIHARFDHHLDGHILPVQPVVGDEDVLGDVVVAIDLIGGVDQDGGVDVVAHVIAADLNVADSVVRKAKPRSRRDEDGVIIAGVVDDVGENFDPLHRVVARAVTHAGMHRNAAAAVVQVVLHNFYVANGRIAHLPHVQLNCIHRAGEVVLIHDDPADGRFAVGRVGADGNGVLGKVAHGKAPDEHV